MQFSPMKQGWNTSYQKMNGILEAITATITLRVLTPYGTLLQESRKPKNELLSDELQATGEVAGG